ncbi:MAG: YidC/Oxa1 family membrane protein insertase [Oscillospiraceae bacterium]|nr:YidC/Oxa1 family membrane protein insertase [Oscillospiraceae bacterium]
MDNIQFLYSIIGTPLGYILYFIYQFICSNVGIAILLFTLIIKIAMLPISIKQQKNTAKSAIFAPKVKEIQTKYRNNQQKQQEELAKLQQQGYNPMGGCGSMLLTFLLLFGVLDVVYKPMTHIEHISSSKIEEIIEESYSVELTSIFVNEVSRDAAELADMKEDAVKKHDDIVKDAGLIIDYYNANCLAQGETPKDISLFAEMTVQAKEAVNVVVEHSMLAAYALDDKSLLFTNTDLYALTEEENNEMALIEDQTERDEYKAQHSFSDATREQITNTTKHMGSHKVIKNKDEDAKVDFQPNSALQRELYALEAFGTGDNRNAYSPAVIGPELKETIIELYDNLNFIGIPLGQVPWEHMGFPLLLIPIVSFLMALLQTFISNKTMAKNNPEAAAGMGAMKVTLYIMPLFSLFLAFTIPAGAGFYWTISYFYGIIQTLVLNKLYNPERLKAQAEAEYALRMKQVEIEAKRVRDTDKDDSIHEYNGEQLSQKEINRRKLAEARRQDAIKYGEEYKDDD